MKNTEKEPTYYEIIFIENNIRYRYGFEHNLQRIVGEWLFIKKRKKKGRSTIYSQRRRHWYFGE
ncbi:MAG: hypothetical protein ACLRXZ_08720 [Alistipes finegoldii]|uniref:hypothetical protein n=1 Tax=Alistipes finegoldii TaxID=214856 RepID=UPI0039A1A6F6